MSFAASGVTSEDLTHLRGLIEAGRLRPVTDGRCSLEQMAEAHPRAESGHKLGNLVVVVASLRSRSRPLVWRAAISPSNTSRER